MADAPLRAQAGLRRHDEAQDLVRMQAAFHQHLDLATAGERHGGSCRRMAVLGRYEPQA